MPKQTITESRSDFSGGINPAAARDALNENELARCENARIEPFGGITRRVGSRKLNPTPLNGPIVAIQMVSGLGTGLASQLVAITSVGNTNIGYFWFAFGPRFVTWFNLGQMDNSVNISIPSMQTFRASAPGAPLWLFVAYGNGVITFDGTNISTTLAGINSVPFATRVKAFGSRLFMNDSSDAKKLFWSKIGDGTDFRTGASSDGGNALVDVLNGDDIVGLESLHSSIMIATNESIARFTGTADDIQIHQDTEGVSSTIGPTGFNYSYAAFNRIDQFIAVQSERGVYIATEAGVLSIGDKIQSIDQQALQMTNNILSVDPIYVLTPIIGHNRQRNEVWIAYVPSGGTKRTNVLVYNYRRQCWYGPFFYQFGITSFGAFLNDNNVESIIAGCDDGYVRALDDLNAGTLDDGQFDFDSVIEMPYFGLGSGPHLSKTLNRVYLQTVGTLPFNVTASNETGETDVATLVP